MKLPLFLYKTNYHGRALKEFSKGDFSGVPASCKLFTIGPLLLPPPGLLLAGLQARTQLNGHFDGDSHRSPSPLVSGRTPKGGTTESQHHQRCPIWRARWAGDLQPGKSGVSRAALILLVLMMIRRLWMVTNLVKVARQARRRRRLSLSPPRLSGPRLPRW